jgi:hypothetical protein
MVRRLGGNTYFSQYTLPCKLKHELMLSVLSTYAHLWVYFIFIDFQSPPPDKILGRVLFLASVHVFYAETMYHHSSFLLRGLHTYAPHPPTTLLEINVRDRPSIYIFIAAGLLYNMKFLRQRTSAMLFQPTFFRTEFIF